MTKLTLGALCACLLTASTAWTAVVGINVRKKTPVLNGRAFGNAGAYELTIGTAHFAVDPNNPRNKGIADIQHAPVNAKGQVEFSADVCILRPVDLKKGNGTILFEVPNRGKKGMLSTFDRARSAAEPSAPEDFGDGLLLNAGYTLVWLGWQHDVPAGDGIMRLNVPVAKGVKGLVRSEYTPDKPVTSIPLGDSGHVPYPVATGSAIRVSVRDDIYGERTALPPGAWALDPTGVVKLSSPAQPGRIYEVIYESADPPVSGLGMAGIRDVVSYLKHDHKYAMGFGTSQSAMVLKALVYEGFNQDEAGKMVLDGIFANVAGGRRSTFQRFVQASRTAGPLRNASLSTTEQFPFADIDQTDPVTGARDGVLHRAAAAKQIPKIFYTNSAYEYWGSAASLLHTSLDGKRDIEVPATTRIYMFSGGQHGPAPLPPRRGNGQNLPSFNDYRPVLRALLGRLQSWIAAGEAPPASQYPTIAAGTLTPLAKYRFPAVPGLKTPEVIHTPRALDFGPEYRNHGTIANEPPKVLGAWNPLVPQADDNGNDIAGVRMPEISCALGSFTGWNLRNASAGGTRFLLGQTGSYVPFPWTEADRRTSGDPRSAVQMRFPSSAEYLACVRKQASELAAKGLLLSGDIDAVTQTAYRHWQWRAESAGTATASRGAR